MDTVFHVLDVRAVWVQEFANSLNLLYPTIGWLPQFSLTGLVSSGQALSVTESPGSLRIQSFLLPRGFYYRSIDRITQLSRRLSRAVSNGHEGHNQILICTHPGYAHLAQQWRGRVVYYVTDFIASPNYSTNYNKIRQLDSIMVSRADLVCPNSERIADYLQTSAGCPYEKLLLLPNAVRSVNVLANPAICASTLPADCESIPRPVAGVIGNLANNMDWLWLKEVIIGTPWLSWLFVGPTSMPVADIRQRNARSEVMQMNGRVYFTGQREYGELFRYARALDVAVLPYRKVEPTYSGSSTRFYEHLAACRPIISTDGFAELLEKESFLRLAYSSAEAVGFLESLRSNRFRDNVEQRRWHESGLNTWDARARRLASHLDLETCTGN